MRIATALFCVALILPCVAHAQDQQLFSPTSGWLVGPASVSPAEGGNGLPCIMMDQYENGFTFRYSGGGHKLYALAIDFRQAVFKPGAHYPLQVTIDRFSRKIDAAAYNEATLIISIRDQQTAQGLYQAIAKGDQMTIGLGKKTIAFALSGVADGLKRMEGCYGVTPDVAGDDTLAAPSIPNIVVHPETPPPALGGVDALLGQAAARNVAASKILPVAPRSTPASESVSAPVSTPPAPEPASVPAPAQVSDPSPSDISHPPDMPADVPSTSEGTTPASADVSMTFTVKSKSSLHATLSSWSDKAGAVLTWDLSGDFDVPESFNLDGTFDQAVQGLLTEYDKENPRPAGTVTVDPSTGKKQLHVTMAGP